MQYHISPTIRTALLKIATAAVPREICGFLLGRTVQDQIKVDDYVPVANGSVLPERFVIRESETQRARHAAAERGRQVVALFHSHPNGPAELSLADQKSLRRSPIPWVLIDVPLSQVTLHQ